MVKVEFSNVFDQLGPTKFKYLQITKICQLTAANTSRFIEANEGILKLREIENLSDRVILYQAVQILNFLDLVHPI